MKNDIDILKIKFMKIKKMGWIESDGKNYGNIGLVFEKLVGIETNEFEIPDFGSIEIKTKSKSKFNYISLFNCIPTGPYYHEVEKIKDSFGYPDLKMKEFKVFNGDIFADKLNKIGNEYFFKLNICRETNKITMCVYNKYNKKIEESTYWDFDILEEKLNRKLSYLALISTDKKIINNKLLFKYNSIKFYKLKGFDTFLDLLEKGFIKLTFKLGIYKDEKRLGKIHDRGTSFSIEKKYVNRLFDAIE